MSEDEQQKAAERRQLQAERFLKLAARGGRGGASGEKTCRALAQALHKIGDDVMILDPDAIEGFCVLLRSMAGPFDTWDQKERVYDLVRKVAGK